MFSAETLGFQRETLAFYAAAFLIEDVKVQDILAKPILSCFRYHSTCMLSSGRLERTGLPWPV